jgi:hypothetical protein
MVQIMEIIIIGIFIVIILLCVSILSKKYNYKEGYADISNPSGSFMQMTDKPTEADRLIILNEIYNNAINHEKALNIYDPTYPLQNISINNNGKIIDNALKIIPFLKKQDEEIKNISKNGYISSETLESLEYITDCSFSLSGLINCKSYNNNIENIQNKALEIYEKWEDINKYYTIYYKARNENRNVDREGDYKKWYTNQFRGALFPTQYRNVFDNIFNTYGQISGYTINKAMGIEINQYALVNNTKLELTIDQINNIYDDMMESFQSARSRDRFQDVSNWRDWFNFQLYPDFPKKYIADFQEIFDTYRQITTYRITQTKNRRFEIANQQQKLGNDNIIRQLALDLYRLIYNSDFVNMVQAPQIKDIANGMQGSVNYNLSGEARRNVYNKLGEIQTNAVVDNTNQNPPLTELQALNKIESVILFHITKIIEYQDLEIKNISNNELNKFKKTYNIHI